ncbi:MAG TPA: hypothetical protein VI248_04710 [Kineosporiaceae bacterium]
MNLDHWNASHRRDRQAGTTARLDRAVTDEPLDGRDGTIAGPRPTAATSVLDRRAVVARQREAFGGVKLGSAFFGWLTATGTAVLLTALVAAGGTAVGVLNGQSVSHPDVGVTWRGTRGAVMIVLILFAAYFCGGYVAGRMARFNGARQGLAVFAWAVVIMLVVAALGALAGTQWAALSAVTGIPRFSAGSAWVTADGVLIGLLAGVAALVGAWVGGLAGMRYHRRVDRVGLGA